MVYNRPWKSFPEQLELLKSRGLVVTDEAAALDYLQRVGYYRLSAYWYPFRKFEVVHGRLATKAVNGFQPGTQFVAAVHLYLFDKQLRLYLADALERIEISLRVDLSYLLGKRSPFAHIENTKAHFHPGFASRPFHRSSAQSAFDAWLNMVERFFRDLTTDRLRRGVFHSVADLIAAIESYVASHNENPNPFMDCEGERHPGKGHSHQQALKFQTECSTTLAGL